MMKAENYRRRVLRWLLNRLESFFAAIAFKIIQLKDKWGMKE